MLTTVRKIFDLLDREDRWKLGLIGAGMVALGLMEAMGIASIMPFMAVVADPGIIFENRWLHGVYVRLGFEGTRSMLIFLGVVVLVLLTLRNLFSALISWGMFRFTWDKNHRFSVRLINKYLYRPYTSYLRTNTSSLHMNILSEVQEVINGLLSPMLKILSNAVVMVSILVLLLLVDARLALIVTVTLGGIYGLIYLTIRWRLSRAADLRLSANRGRYRAAAEALGGIKTIKAFGREPEFARRFSGSSREFTRNIIAYHLMSDLPRYFLETIAFGGIIVIVLYLLGTREDAGAVMSILALYAYAGYRLMPNLQQTFQLYTTIRFRRPSLDVLHRDLREEVGLQVHPGERRAREAPLEIDREIEIDRVTFRYPGTVQPVLDEVSVRIPRNRTVAFVGMTGSGKTTLVDILLGLLEPDEGAIRVDGRPITPRLMGRWKATVGYVPQDIYLSDDTIARNIAFGIPESDVDPAAVERASRIAHLHDFVAGLEEGYGTVVGERGIRLSGGQRQRVGIARALYEDPPLLLFDEATSALDTITEDEVMRAVQELTTRKTIVLIAHRLSTVHHAFEIHLLEEGRVVARGSYEELLATSDRFRELSRRAETPAAPWRATRA